MLTLILIADMNLNFLQQLVQMQQNAHRYAPIVSPAGSLQNLRPALNLETNLAAHAYAMTPAEPTVSRSSAPIPDTSSRPPHISSFTPSENLRPMNETQIRASAPHLKRFRPRAYVNGTSQQAYTFGMSSQPENSNLATSSPPLPCLPPRPQSLTSQASLYNRAHRHDATDESPADPISSPALGLSLDVDGLCAANSPISISLQPDLTLDLVWPKSVESGASKHTNQQPIVQASGSNDIVCLSDDD